MRNSVAFQRHGILNSQTTIAEQQHEGADSAAGLRGGENFDHLILREGHRWALGDLRTSQFAAVVLREPSVVVTETQEAPQVAQLLECCDVLVGPCSPKLTPLIQTKFIKITKATVVCEILELTEQ